MERNELDECGEMVEWNVWQEKTWEPRGKPTQLCFVHHDTQIPDGLTETRIRDLSGGRLVSNRLRHGAMNGMIVISIDVPEE